MHLKDESFVCACKGCVASLLDRTKGVTEEQNMPRASRSNSKKVYRSPKLIVYGTLADLIHAKCHSSKI
jgi:hypothetical protein